MRKRYITAALITILLSFNSCGTRDEQDVESTSIIDSTLIESSVSAINPTPTIVPSTTENPTPIVVLTPTGTLTPTVIPTLIAIPTLAAIPDPVKTVKESEEEENSSSESLIAPRIDTGIVVGNATGYTGYEVIVTRSYLPVWAQDYSSIGIAVSCIVPFDVPRHGLPFDKNSILPYQESIEGITTIGAISDACKWYVLVALFDENNKPIGYIDTPIDVVESQLNLIPTLSPTPVFITREGIDYVYEVLESYYKDMDHWNGNEFYGADRTLWFKNYDPANTTLTTGEDIISASPSASDHIYYYEDTTGKMKVEEVAKELVKLLLEDMSSKNSNCTFQVTDYIVNSQVLYNKEDLIEKMKKKADNMTSEDLVFETQEELDYLQQNMRMLVSMYPALQEDMWLSTPSYQYRYEGNVSPLGPYPEDAGEYILGGSDGSEELYYFVIMKYGNVYRMQNHFSFCSYAKGIIK